MDMGYITNGGYTFRRGFNTEGRKDEEQLVKVTVTPVRQVKDSEGAAAISPHSMFMILLLSVK